MLARRDHDWSPPACATAAFKTDAYSFQYGIPDRHPCGVVQKKLGQASTYEVICQARRQDGMVPYQAVGHKSQSADALRALYLHLFSFQCPGRFRTLPRE